MERNIFGEFECAHDIPLTMGCNGCQRKSGQFDKDGLIRDHGFVPVRSNPSVCNDCGKEQPAHLHQQQQF